MVAQTPDPFFSSRCGVTLHLPPPPTQGLHLHFTKNGKNQAKPADQIGLSILAPLLHAVEAGADLSHFPSFPVASNVVNLDEGMPSSKQDAQIFAQTVVKLVSDLQEEAWYSVDAAAFKAPFAGIMFVVEELASSMMSVRLVTCALLANACAFFTVFWLE